MSTKITELVAKTKYTFCLVAENEYGPTSGAAESFETKPSTPVIQGAGASVKENNVTLSASVNPELEAATCVFQYGKSENYEHETPCQALGEGNKGVAVSDAVAGLEADTTYDYRIIANNKRANSTQAGLTQPTILPVISAVRTVAIEVAASVKGNRVVVSVRTSVCGTVTISGTGLNKTSKTFAAGTHQVAIALTKAGKKDAKRHKKITLQAVLKADGKSVMGSKALKL